MKYGRKILDQAEDSLSKITQLIADHSIVLDLGVGTGELGKHLSEIKHCEVDGVDQSEQHLDVARPHYRRIEQVDLEQPNALQAFAEQRYDYVVLADVLEHVMDARGVLARASELLKPEGELLLSVPNVGYAGVCLELLEGRFDYRSEGILDDTHVRFYTRDSLLSLLEEQGYNVVAVDTVRKPLHRTEFSGFAPELLPKSLVDLLLARPDSLVYQYILRVKGEASQATARKPAHYETETGVINQFETRLYWMSSAELQHNEEKLERRWATLNEDDAALEFHLSDAAGIELLRYSPADRAGLVRLQSLTIKNNHTDELIDVCARPLPGEVLAQHIVVEHSDDGYQLLCTDSNAWFEIDLQSLFGDEKITDIQVNIKQSWPMSQDYAALLAIYEDVNQKNADLADQVVEHRAHRRGLAGEIALLKESLASKEAEIAQLQNQTRPTVPGAMRKIAHYARKVLNRLPPQRCRLELSAVTNGEHLTEPGWLRMTGDSGHLYFQTPPELAGKTVFFDISYSSESRLMGPKLYKVIAGELQEINAPLYEDRNGRDLFGTLLLPDDLQGLVLAPSRLDCTIQLVSFKLKVLGPFPRAVMDYWHWAWCYRVFGPGWVWEHWTDEASMFFENFPRLGKCRSYADWWRKYGSRSQQQLAQERSQCEALAWRPRISIVMPTFNTPETLLNKAVESILRQSYPDWELCIADDCSNPETRAAVQKVAQLDPRIKLKIREENGHISAATNDAIALASGDYVAFMDHDDELAPDALFRVANALQGQATPRLIYTDEDVTDADGEPIRPHFKPDWNPDYLLSVNYFCHLLILQKELLDEIGGLREGYEGAQDYDLILRAVSKLEDKEILHIPRVLYHWRAIEGSTADDIGHKSYAVDAGQRALQDHMAREGIEAEVEVSELGMAYRIRYPLAEPPPSVEVLMPTRDSLEVLSHCIKSVIERTDYPNFHITVIDNGSSDPDCLEYLDQIQSDPRVSVERYPEEFNFSAIMNFGARSSQADILLLLNNDMEVINGDWMQEMVSHANRPEIGAVGAKLFYASDFIQHAGVVLGLGFDSVAGHAFKGFNKHETGHMGRLRLIQNYSAVTGACLAVSRTKFEQVQGMDEENLAIAFNDVDFCLKLVSAGYRNLWTPYAQLYHFESYSRGYDVGSEKRKRFERERDHMKDRWGDILQRDPAYNPNLTRQYENFDFGWPPR